MARQRFIEFQNAFYHVMSRGLNRQFLFFGQDDFIFFLWLLNQAKEKFGFLCHGYCLMNNHYHLYLQTPNANLSLIMKYINETYARYFLKKYPDKDGHVFKGRYKRKIVQTDLYSLQLSRYIHLNPVKAGLVKHPHEWKWSSYNSYIGLQTKNKFLETDWLLSQFSVNKKQSQEMITKYTYEDIECNWDPEHHTTIGKLILGSKEFSSSIFLNLVDQESLGDEVLKLEEYKISKNIEPEYIINKVRKLNFSKRDEDKLLIYYLKEHTNLSLTSIGDLVNKNLKTVSKSYHRSKRNLSEKMKNLFSDIQ